MQYDRCRFLEHGGVLNDIRLSCLAEDLKLERGPMPNVMAALPNIGVALCSTPQSLADAHYWSVVQ